MQRSGFRLPFTLVLLLVFLAGAADGTTILRMDLAQMVDRAGNVFRGTVLDVRGGTIDAGGATLPTTTYVLRVEEAFKGSFDKEGATVEVTMLGSLKQGTVRVGTFEKFSFLPKIPELSIGSDYLLLVTPASPIGLSTAVGLEQGAFSIFVADRQELAVNGLDNSNLGESGPVPYSELAAKIRALLGQ